MKSKICTKCKKRKLLSEFHRHKNRKGGLQSWCKKCKNVKQQERLLKQNFGLTLADYDQMFEQQGGVCRTCGKINLDGRRLYVDHDHKTGKVRGLLCHKCNSVLGYVDDNIDLLLKIASYLTS